MSLMKIAEQLRGIAAELEAKQKVIGLLAGEPVVKTPFIKSQPVVMAVGPVKRHRRSKLSRLHMRAGQLRHHGNKEELAKVEAEIAAIKV